MEEGDRITIDAHRILSLPATRLDGAAIDIDGRGIGAQHADHADLSIVSAFEAVGAFMAGTLPAKEIAMSANSRSRHITQGVARSPNRAMYYALGYTEADFDKPMIGRGGDNATPSRRRDGEKIQ